MKLEDIVAITGASGGIDDAIVRDLESQDCKFVFTARSPNKLKAVCGEIDGAISVADEAAGRIIAQPTSKRWCRTVRTGRYSRQQCRARWRAPTYSGEILKGKSA